MNEMNRFQVDFHMKSANLNFHCISTKQRAKNRRSVNPWQRYIIRNKTYATHLQGSHFFRLTKFHDISMIFPGFLENVQVFFHYFLKYDFQVVLNINMQTYWVTFEQKIIWFILQIS